MSAPTTSGTQEIKRPIRGYTMRKLTIAGFALATALTAGCATTDQGALDEANATASSAEQTAENALNTANSASSAARSAQRTADEALAAAKAAQKAANEANERAKRMLERASQK
mmetsp:Transcript_8911/g.14534  ORF Transcript_8911/g.14534 Transcript_8911/m.14534 type:complete len:114 (-) Transcript_8911:52-393(-)